MKTDYNLIICGGGLTGVAAAIAAGRSGIKDVLLIERYGFLGGMATAGLVNPFMSYFKSLCERTEENRLLFGIFGEILDRLDQMGALKDRVYFDTEIMKLILNRMIMESGAEVLFHTFISDAKAGGEHINEITVANKRGMYPLYSKLFIDCTGDGDVAYWAGVKCRTGRDKDGFSQPMTMCFRLAGVDSRTMASREEINRIYAEAVKRGEISNPRENVLFFETLRDDVIHFNTTRIIKKDATHVKDLTDAEFLAREQCYEMYLFMKNNIRGFENSYLQVTAPQTGIRESRRIEGIYELTEDDVLSGRKFEDSICYSSYCVDIHNPAGSGTIIKRLKKGDYYGIPLRCLIPLGIDNLIVAGRPISATHEAHSSLRIMPNCAAMGEAAGYLAAISINENIRPGDVNPLLVRERQNL